MAGPASMTKNRMVAEIPIPEPVDEALRGLMRKRDAAGGGAVFATEPTLRTWMNDLRRARLIGKPPRDDPDGPHEGDSGYIDERGRRLDRKCLRMSFCHWLEDAGVDLRDAQALMRHSDPKLTANTYRGVRIQKAQRASDLVAETTLRQKQGATGAIESNAVQRAKQA